MLGQIPPPPMLERDSPASIVWQHCRSPFDAEKVTLAQLYQHVPLFFFVILKRVFYNLEVEDSVLEEEDEDLQEVAAVPAAHLHHSCGHLWHCSRHITESMAVRYNIFSFPSCPFSQYFHTLARSQRGFLSKMLENLTKSEKEGRNFFNYDGH